MTPTNVAYIFTQKAVSLNYNGRTVIVPKEHVEYKALEAAIKAKSWDLVQQLVDTMERIKNYGKGKFEVKDGVVKIDDDVLPDEMNKKIVAFMTEGLPYEPLVNFWRNVKQNPDPRAKTDLYTFLEKNGHPLTEDGYFIAYKRVADDFSSLFKTDQKIYNRVGDIVTMLRDQVNSDPNTACAAGLHVANYRYANEEYHSGEGVLVDCKVNPKDVVAIPTDHNQEKMRVCQYEVLAVSQGQRKEKVAPQTPSTPPQNPPVVSLAGGSAATGTAINTPLPSAPVNVQTPTLVAVPSVPQLSKDQVEKAIVAANGVITIAASNLNIPRSSLYSLRKKYNLV